ncbi:MAG: response regulator [Betaproteobacteria bacterium]|nr:response regulator [Betaproteobacteria bacterium]
MNPPIQTKLTSSGQAPARVLVVDDMATNRALVRAVLDPMEFQVQEANSGEDALARVGELQPDVVLLDVLMPGLDGFEVCQALRDQEEFRLLPVILLTSLGSPDDVAHGMEVGATDYVTKPFHAIELEARVRAAVEKKRLTDRLDDTESVLFALARVVEAKDGTTGDHCDRLSHLSVVLGEALGLPFDDLEALRRGGILHDIGKVAIPDAILLKKGPLSEEEWAIMRQHPAIGAYLCSALRTMRRTVDIIRFHHEKWNGSGYPSRLSGADIPLLARVFQIVDVYDALSTERPYKKMLPQEEVIRILRDETRQGYWDAEIMTVFLGILERDPGRLELPANSGHDRDAEIFRHIVGGGVLDWRDRR